MKEFFILEGAYIAIALFGLLITVYVTTRPFMPKGALKKGLISIIAISGSLIMTHFYVTKSRMQEIKQAFYNKQPILCENRIYTKAAQFITILPDNQWRIENDTFKSPNYERSFHLARCIKK